MRTCYHALSASLILLSLTGCQWAFHVNQNPHVPARTPQSLRIRTGDPTYIRVMESGVLSASPNLEISCAFGEAMNESCKRVTEEPVKSVGLLEVEEGALILIKRNATESTPRIASLCLHRKPRKFYWPWKLDYKIISSSACSDPLKIVDVYIADDSSN